MTLQTTMHPKEWAMLILLSVLWGGSFFFAKVAVVEIPPFSIVFLRVALASITLLIFLKISGREIPLSTPAWLAFFGMGLINNVIPFSLLFWAQTEIASGLAAIFNATTPLFSIVLAHFLTADEGITPRKLIGIVMGVIGVAILIGFDVFDDIDKATLAMFACLGAAFMYGCASVFGRRFRKLEIAPVSVAFGQVTASSVMMIPIVLWFDQPWNLPPPSAGTWTAIITLAVFCTAFAYVLFFRILSAAGASNVSLVTLLVPVSAILLGAVFLGERLAANHVIGMSVIALGLLVIDGRLWRLFVANVADKK